MNDTSSVVATASTYGPAAANYAVVVKLTRTLMIIPICLFLSALTARRSPQPAGIRASGWRCGWCPWFLLAFLAAAGANSVGLVPASSHIPLSKAALFLTTTALAAVGLSTDAAQLRRSGSPPFCWGCCFGLTVTATSLLLQWATG